MKCPRVFSFFKTILLVSAAMLLLHSCNRPEEEYRLNMDLSGYWQFSMDTANSGIQQEWFNSEFQDSILLPGTMDSNHKGFKNTDTTIMHLNRLYKYEGPAWYKRVITIPSDWEDHHIELTLERTKPSEIWIDGKYAGSSMLLESPQHFDLTSYLSPGKHTITVRINNSLKLTPYGNVHIYSDDTQTNWNGIIGDIRLTASNKTWIKDLQVYPDIREKQISVKLVAENPLRLANLNVELQITRYTSDNQSTQSIANYRVPFDSVIEISCSLENNLGLWDEFQQPVYRLNAIISDSEKKLDNKVVPFGMREFGVKGTQFTINGRTTFLRGKHDACVFPLTGHPPMDTAGWMRVFRIAKSYGINHYRFHTWCPPEAAFEAGDHAGIYLEPELPFWGGLDSDTTADMLTNEGIALLKSYANHPSFVMLSPGNEIWSGHERVKRIIDTLKLLDNRPLYTQGSNNNIGYVGPMEGTDFQVAARTPFEKDTTLTHTRLTQAFADSRQGGILNTQQPSTAVNFDYAVQHTDMPLISHEVGQYQIYPNYKEISKYTGVLRAWNLEVFRNRLKKAGMLDQDSAFTKASGVWSALCYRAEIEAALRTKGLAGFQLLDLQDFPGQGTALVGILDAFMDSKGVISPDAWRHFCNDVVPLLEFDKYCWTTDEIFKAHIQTANYSNQDIKENLIWKAVGKDGNLIASGTFSTPDIKQGGLRDIGDIKIPLKDCKVPEKLTVTLSLAHTNYSNSYPVWVYPEAGKPDTKDIVVAENLSSSVINELKNGRKVLLLPDKSTVEQNSVGGLFPPDFWNYGMFKGISEWVKKPVSPGTLGILTNPEHPLFNSFPTEFHTDWQWWSIIKASNPLILDSTEKAYRPIVQVIDNLERNHKLGLIFEFKSGKGKLLVCMSRLNDITNHPEAAQLYRSIIDYMESEQFNPTYEINEELLKEIFR